MDFFVFLLLDNERVQAIEGEEVGDFMGGGILNDIGPDNLFWRRFFIMEKPMVDFCRVKFWGHIKVFEIAFE